MGGGGVERERIKWRKEGEWRGRTEGGREEMGGGRENNDGGKKRRKGRRKGEEKITKSTKPNQYGKMQFRNCTHRSCDVM